jgi:crotonobetainyl-CoA:carnitine CoA-transferase CaiB-like acyl-CoA transferase
VIEGLSHIRVIDLTSDIAGPYCTKLLADAGADVIKVETPDGDPMRHTTATGAPLGGEDSALFRFLNTSKRSIIGRLGEPHVDELVAGADLLVEDAGPGGVDVAALRAAHPHLVVVSLSPYGLRGPIADRPANEFIVQAESGSTLYRGRPSREPVHAGGRVGEFVGGSYAAPPAIAAVLRAKRTGIGEHIDVSLAEGMVIAASTFADLSHFLHGRPELTTSIRNLETPSIEPAKDGWVGFNTNTGQMFQNFLLLIERPDLLDDAELASFAGRVARGDEWREIMQAYLGRHTVDEIVEQAAALRIPVAPVCNGETILKNDHLLARGVFVENPAGFVQPRPPYMIDGGPVRAFAPAPALGEHTGRIEPRPTPVPTDPGADPAALPLAGLKVLDLTSWWAGPSSTQFLVAMGAEVVHVESTSHPDGMRMTGYFYGRPDWWEWGHMFVAVNTDKLGVTLDLGTDQGRALCVELVEWADVVVENFAPRVVENWGLDRDGILAINPNVVYCRMPAFGLTGPWRDRVGFAQTMEQLTMAWITGYPDDQPMIPRGPCDPLAGLHSAVAMLTALVERDRRGSGVFIESTMLEAALNVCAQPIVEHSAYGRLMERLGNRSPYAAPQGVYQVPGFDNWLALSIETDEQWSALRTVLGEPGWAAAPELATFDGRMAAHDDIDAHLRAWADSLGDGAGLDAAVDRLVAAGVPAARAWDPRILGTHPQFVARGFFEEVEHASIGVHPVPGLPYRFTSVDRWTHRGTATLGQDNHDVLTRILGRTDEQIAALEADGIIGTRPNNL